MAHENIIDVDLVESWPPPVATFVNDWARRLAATTSHTCDLGGVALLEADEQFRSLLRGYRLRAYHCTRLMDHEIEMVRARGLVPLGEPLIINKLAAALRSGAIRRELHDLLIQQHVLTDAEQARSRRDQVCLVLSRQAFEHNTHACAPLLEIWGGEAINWLFGRTKTENTLRTLGRPAIVSAMLDLGTNQKSIHAVYPSLARVFVGTRLGRSDVSADVFYRAPIVPADIEDIWHPGHPEYDRYKELPTA